MRGYPAVLVGTDGGTSGQVAVQVAAQVAARLAAPLTVVTAWGADGDGTDYVWATEVAQSAAAAASAAGAGEVDTVRPNGRPAEALAALAHEHPDRLLVLGGPGTSRTSSRLSHNSEADLLFAHHPLADAGGRVALTTDGSATSRDAVRRGIALATALGAQPELVTVAKDRDEGDRLIAASANELELDRPDLAVTRTILTGLLPGKALVEASADYDLMVIGNRRMSGASRLLGSVAKKVTHGAATNLLLVNTSA